MSTGHEAQALARVKTVVVADANSAPARNLLGEIYLAQKNYAQAAVEFEQVTHLMPQWWLPYRNLALARIAANDVAGGLKAYESSLTPTNYDPTLVTDLAALYERQNRIDDAIKQYEALNQRNPRLDVVANNLAMLLVTYKTDRVSLDRAEGLTASFAQSDNPALLDTHGWVRFKRGELTEALPALERAAQRAPESKVIRYHLAMAQVRSGQRDKALTNLEQALAGATNFAGMDEARSTLADLKKRSG
jgi:tetratricopeptide (TPR) repeat protein